MFIGIIILVLLLALVASIFIFLFTMHRSAGVSKVKMLEDALPGDNCGKCGYQSCHNFAHALTMNHEKIVDKCSLMSAKEQQHVRNLLGYYAKERIHEVSSLVAYIACNERGIGLKERVHVAKNLSCSGVVELVGNNFSCYESCVGMGECIGWCPRHAIYRSKEGKISIDAQKCSGCGICVSRCPKSVIKLIPRESAVVIACNSHDSAEVKALNCSSGGCNGCGLCSNLGGVENFSVNNVLAKRGSGVLSKDQMRQIIERCPTQIIHSVETKISTNPALSKK